MKSLTLTKRLLALAAVGTLLATTATSRAQQIYLNTFNTDDSANWAVNWSYTAGPVFATISNSLVDFNCDYTTLGVPIAPHSHLFGSDVIHHGLKVSACYTNPVTLKVGATAGVSLCPTNFSVSQDFVMHADVWMNVDCSAFANVGLNNDANNSYATSPHNSTASTVFYGCGYGTLGTDATVPGHSDAIWVGALTDNGSSAQYRMYGPSSIGVASYQDGTYQSTGTTTPGFPGDPLVYNFGNAVNGLGCRNVIGSAGAAPFAANLLSTNLATGVLWSNIFPPTVAPLAQQILHPQQTNNASCPGFLTFAWHDVSVEKVGSVIVYKVDGNIIATGNYASAGTPPGHFLDFVATRTGTGVASASSPTAPVYTNLNFGIFANIVVSNYNNIVNASATVPITSEATPGSPGVITLTRGSAGVPLTVNYTLSGTATNGAQYTIGPGATATNVTFASTALTTNISIVPIDDGIPSPTNTVILTLQAGAGYGGAGSVVISILDNDTPTVDITSSSQAYGRYNNTSSIYYDFISYNVTRRGKVTTGSDLTVNLAYSGSAVSGTDYTPVSSITIPDGSATPSAANANGVAGLQIVPLDNPSATGNRTVVVSLAPGTGYAIGNSSATGMVVSAHYPAAPVLLSDDLTSSTSPETNKWSITYGCGDPLNNSANYSADFGLSLSGASIPAPPGGNANALHLTCNKQIPSPGGAPGAVNVYYTNLWLDGDYAVRFNMNLIEGQVTANNTEGAIFGINHSGSLSNWWAGSGFVTNYNWASDGVWFYLTSQPGGQSQGDYEIFTGLGGTNGNTGWVRPLLAKGQTSFAQVFKDTPGPFTCVDQFGLQSSGVPANGSSAFYDVSTWSDVEIRQQNNVVTMSINRTPIFTYTNTTVWTGGYLMLGYADPFGNTIGSPEAGVYYANLQVVSLQSTPIEITGITINGGNVVITFLTQTPSDTTSSFTLRSTGTLDSPFSDVSPAASITSIGVNEFQATTPYHGGTQLYRIHHN